MPANQHSTMISNFTHFLLPPLLALVVPALAAAQEAGRIRSDIPAIDLFAIVLRMTDSWLSAPAALRAVAGEDPMSSRRLREHRAALLAAVRSVAAPA